MRVARSHEFNGRPLDSFTLIHFLSGCALGALNTSWPTALSVAVGWEIVERPLKDAFPGAFPHPLQDALSNAVVDSVAIMTGWYVTRRALHKRL